MSVSIEAAFRKLLLEDAEVSRLLGERLYAQDAPQDAVGPYVVYATSDPDQALCLNGYANELHQEFRLECWGGSDGGYGGYASAKGVASAIDARLKSFLRGDRPADGLVIEGIFATGGEDGQELPVSGEEEPIDYVAKNYHVVYHMSGEEAP